MKTRPRAVTAIASLAIFQGIVGALVGLLWLELGSIFDQESGAVSSLIVMVAEARGWLLLVLALMYFVFAAGAWRVQGWAWWIGLLVSSLTILYLVSVLLRGGLVLIVLFGLIVPVIILWYLLSPMGRQAFGR
ncbi:hypothetical protein [Petrachloros mirabilis]